MKLSGYSLLSVPDPLLSNVLLLRYERFVNQPSAAVSGVAEFIHGKAPSERVIDGIVNATGIGAAKQLTSGFGSFWKRDRTTELHGFHISHYDGRCGYEAMLTERQRAT